MKKILNEAKADAIAVYNALDIASGGNLSLIKQSIAQTFHGFLEAKFNNLVEDIISGGASEEKLLKFINSHIPKDGDLVSKVIFQDREFIANIILKNMHADNRITTFLLAKLWIQKMKKNSLNYYESSLFTNINSLTYEDFEIYYSIFQNLEPYVEGTVQTKTELANQYYITSLDKFKHIGIIQNSNLISGESFEKDSMLNLNFRKTLYSDTFFDYLKEFFENN